MDIMEIQKCLSGDEMVSIARHVCLSAHDGQVDKMGEPYWKHPFEVARRVSGGCVEKTVAYLHDVVEDTDVTLDDLSNMGFPREVVECVALLTHDKDDDYDDYVRKLSTNPVAKAVKIADISHNTEPSRMSGSTERLQARYVRALCILHGYDE